MASSKEIHRPGSYAFAGGGSVISLFSYTITDMDSPVHPILFVYRLQTPYIHKILLQEGSVHLRSVHLLHNFQCRIALTFFIPLYSSFGKCSFAHNSAARCKKRAEHPVHSLPDRPYLWYGSPCMIRNPR